VTDPRRDPLPSIDETWRTSSRSGQNGACVEVRQVDHTVQVRDSKDRSGPVLSFSAETWQSFVQAVHTGQFDR
jgi:hypothetical protein